MALDKTTQERIKADAEKKYPRVTALAIANRNGYIAGATAEHAQNESVRLQLEAQDANVEILFSQKKELIKRAQVLVDALEEILKQHDYYSVIELAAKALEQWKSGKGKEVGDE